MISKEMIINDLTHEVGVIKHLAEKVLPDTHNWKPTDGQRTIIELLQYLSHVGISFSAMLATGKTEEFAQNAEKAKSLTADQFNSAMDAQLTTMKDTINGLSDEDLQEKMDFFGGSVVTKAWIVLLLVKSIVAYRMQLFLYVKQSGRSELGTMNNWMGMDMPPQS